MAKSAAKGKSKKKQDEMEAARLAAAEEAARLEAERLKLEEQERVKASAEKAERMKIEGERLAVETARLQSERDAEIPFHTQRKNSLIFATATLDDKIEWERYVKCVPRPDPLFDSALNGYLLTTHEKAQKVLHDTLATCQDNELIVKESIGTTLLPSNFDCKETIARHTKYAKDLRELSANLMDKNTAHILQHSDEFLSATAQAAATAKNVLVHAEVGQFKLGLWVNLAKNPRQRAVEMLPLHFLVDLPKSLHLASVAVRLTHLHYDEFTAHAMNEYMVVGGVFTVDLLALPPLPKKVKGWTIRQVTPLATNVQKLPYPIPPAGGEVQATSNTANVLPMGLTFPLPAHVLVLEHDPEVGWWDKDASKWQTDGISEVKYDAEHHKLSFQTTKLLSLGLLLSRIKLLPYDSWHYRPTSPCTGVVSIFPETNPFADPIMIHVSDTGCKLLLPDRPALQPLMDEERPPALLLRMLTDSGIPLLPEDRDAEYCGLDLKMKEVEKKLCIHLALLGSRWMIASSKWNRDATEDDCIFRVKELMDFSRCEERDAVKVFSKPKEGVVIHTVLAKEKGMALLPITDNDKKMPKTMDLQITPHEDISWEQEGLEPLFFAASVRELLKDKMQPDSLECIESASPTFTENLYHLMYTLRLFSFN